jgi:extracellular elastinolytic metalloproteinase
MLQARDAALAADLARFGGANQKELWLGYARSGMGVNATTTNSSLAESDTDPVPDFEALGTRSATVRFSAEGPNGTPVSARIYVGHYEARVSPIADTNPATTGALNLDDTAQFAPGTYEFVAHAPGFGHVRFRERLRSGENERIEVRFARNWASQSAGATATGDVWTGEPAPAGTPASNVNFLIDDTEKTNWTAAPAIGAGGVFSADGLKVTVDLAGSDDVTVRYVQVSTMLWNDTINPNIRSGQNRFTAVRQFELWACNADEGGNCSTDAGYHRVYTSPANAFPGDPPRPVAPHMILRRFDTPNFEATHVRFVVKTTQCTGTTAFQGDQDADPGVNSDCDSNASAGSATAVRSTRAFARAAELQVFDRDPKVNNRSGGH